MTMMKKTILLLLLVCLPGGILFSQENENKRAGFQLSFFPPLSTQGMQASQYSNAVSFNLLAGVSREVTAFSMSGLGMYVKEDLGGFHFSGLATIASGNGKGAMMSGLFNKTMNYSGFQMGGLANVSTDFEGFQFAGLTNIASGDMKGFQFGGLANIVSGDMKGFQFGGLINKAEDVNGAQFAGLVNIAKNVKGFQFAALLNIAESNAYPVGLVNIIKKDGEMSVGVTYNEIGSTMLSFRSGGRVLYGIIGLGYNHKIKDDHFMAEAGLGAHINIVPRFRINTEIKAASAAFEEDDVTFHTNFSILPAFKILPQWEVFGGPSINYLQTDNLNNENMFPSHNIWKDFGVDKLKQLYIGFTVGTHFIF